MAYLRLRRDRGFTIVEILIVVSIIAILASIVAGAVVIVRKQAAVTVTQTKVDRIKIALEQFRSDEGYYPGAEVSDTTENAFPAAFEALLGDPRPKGKGGRSAPYLEDIKLRDIVVYDDINDEYRQASQEERFDPEVPKYLVDEWGQPFWYRENKSKKRELFMKNPHKFDVWSIGPDNKNQTLLEEEKTDDIGNW